MKAISALHLIVFPALLFSAAGAQIASPGAPASSREHLADDVPLAVLPPPDVAALMAEDETRGNWPFRYGALVPAALDAESSGRWEELPDGGLVWRLSISSPGALSLGVLFDGFRLPAGGELYLYDPARTVVLGAYTSADELPDGGLPVQPVPGDVVVLEYVQPAGVAAAPELSVGHVVHDYRDILGRLGRGSVLSLVNCLVDVNCPAGAPYQDIKRSVVGLLRGGFVCSGSILNNTAQDGTPYLLTANHCGSMTNAVVVFGYERTGCGSGTSSQANTVAGATLLAASSNFDSQLYLLSSAPPASYQPFYAGWDRRTSQPAPGVSISHPSGLPKKIAIDDEEPINGGNRWIASWEIGKLEGGSSGSPLFNGEQRVIGPACCVSDFNCNSQLAMYGRFTGFWNNEGIATWLDPLGTHQLTLDGYDPFLPLAIPYNGSGLNPSVYSSITRPGVGSTWTAEIDASGHAGAVAGWILGYTGPSSGVFLGIGELLVNPASTRAFLSKSPVAGGVAVHSNPIPSNPALVGLTAYSQGLILGGGLELTNAIELRLR